MFLIVGEVGGFAFEEFAEGEDRAINVFDVFDLEAGFGGMIDEEGKEGDATVRDEGENGRGDRSERAGAGLGAAGKVDDELACRYFGVEDLFEFGLVFGSVREEQSLDVVALKVVAKEGGRGRQNRERGRPTADRRGSFRGGGDR